MRSEAVAIAKVSPPAYNKFIFMHKISLITGASSGIGKATALLLAQNGYDVIITGRRKALLKELEKEIKKIAGSNALVLSFDICNYGEMTKAIASLPAQWKNIDVLINNAGLALGLDSFQDGKTEDWERMIDTNVKGLLNISRLLVTGMIERTSGHIVNIGSIAGKEVYMNGNVYCASKHAVDALTKGMRIDLLKHGIRVTAIHPGMVETEFSLVRFNGDSGKAKNVYDGTSPLYASDIAEAILFAISRPPHVNINDMLIMPTAQANATHIIRK